MASYSELVKDFEKIRAYMREFYVYGFRSRDGYTRTSPRTYDDERRRIDSWLNGYMRFVRTPEGKNVFLCIDSRAVSHNPLYNAWKAKSFTSKDITLHFIIFDILYDPSVRKSLSELMECIDRDYLSSFPEPMIFDESTVRKKLQEYISEGIVSKENQGRKILYRRTASPDISPLQDVLDFFSEVAPCGVIGSFLLDKLQSAPGVFTYKHHYITQAPDSDIVAELFSAMHEKRYIDIKNSNTRQIKNITSLVPLRIYISTQSGRQYLVAYHSVSKKISSYRIDFLSDVRKKEVCEEFDNLRIKLSDFEKHIWGVNCHSSLNNLQHVDFTVKINENEKYIVNRLQREKRCGSVEKIDSSHWKFSAEVFDPSELIPWIRTFICRITELDFPDPEIRRRFIEDIEKMYALYGITESEKQ